MIYMELQKNLLSCLCNKNTHEEFKKLDEQHILEKIIPKIKEMKSVGECKYHVVNCMEHSLNALQEFEYILQEENFFPEHLKDKIWKYLNTYVEEGITKLQLLKLGVFLHDIGKPDAKTVDETGRVHFKNHEKIGSDIARNLGIKLRLSDEANDILYKYVRHHMALLVFYKTNDLTKEKLNNIFYTLKDEVIGVMLLGYADIVSTRKLLNPNETSGTIKTYMEYIITNYEYRFKRQ